MARTAAPEYRQGDWERTEAARERAAEPDSNVPVVENATEARAGVTGHNVRYVLGFGIAGVVIAFAIIFAVYWG